MPHGRRPGRDRHLGATPLGPRRLALALATVALLVVGAAATGAPGTASVAAGGVQNRAQGLPTWWSDVMHLEEAHEQATGEGVTVALIDDAIDPRAADIRGADITLGIDCEGNRVTPAVPEVGDHGTAMATLLVGTGKGNGPGGRGVRGIAPDATVRFYAMDTDPRTEYPDDCESINGARLFRQAVDDGADIISVSLGFTKPPELQAAIKHAQDHGVVVVASTGDRTRATVTGWMDFPAGLPGTVGVNAVDSKARPWPNNPRPFLRAGRLMFPVVSAPGVDVEASGYQRGRGWVSGLTRTGTSDATPIVAGALALVKSKYPDATGNQLIQHLIHYTTADTFGWDRYYGFGIVSVTKMLAHDPTQWPDVNPLLKGPQAAKQDFPMSVRGRAQTPSAQSTPSDAPSEDTAASGGDDDGSGGGGVPGWVWPGVAVLTLGAVAVAVAAGASRRGGRLATAHDNAKEV